MAQRTGCRLLWTHDHYTGMMAGDYCNQVFITKLHSLFWARKSGEEWALVFFTPRFWSLPNRSKLTHIGIITFHFSFRCHFHENTSERILWLTPILDLPLILTPSSFITWRSHIHAAINFQKPPIVTQLHHDGRGAEKRKEETDNGLLCNVGSDLLWQEWKQVQLWWRWHWGIILLIGGWTQQWSKCISFKLRTTISSAQVERNAIDCFYQKQFCLDNIQLIQISFLILL